jgi:hypothetical protein
MANETGMPLLYAPGGSSLKKGPIDVSYFLPENAAPSTVKLIFTGTTTVELTLDAAHEAAGTYEFTFDARNPQTGPFVGPYPAIPDDVYTVAISYQDVALNPAASDYVPNVRIDTVAPTITAQMGGFAPLVVREGTPLPNYTTQATANETEGSGLDAISQSPAAGTVLPVGLHDVVVTAADYAGNQSNLTFKLRVAPNDPVRTVLFSKGVTVPGSGSAESDIPEGAEWDSFGSPAINDASDMAMVATYRVGNVKYKNIVLKRASGQDVNVIAQVGGAVPGAGGEWLLPADATFAALNDPLLAGDGSLLFTATIKGTGVKGANNKVVVHYPGSGTARTFARTGSVIPTADGAALKTIGAIALESGGAAVLRGTLSVGSGSPKVRPSNDTVALRLHENGELPTVVLREGFSPGGTVPVLKSFLTLVAGDGAPGQGRGWLVRKPGESGADEGGAAIFTAFATDPTGERILVETSFESGIEPNAKLLTGPEGIGAFSPDFFFKSVGLPSRSADGTLAIRGVPKTTPGGFPYKPTILLTDFQSDTPEALNSGNIPETGMKFRSVRDPILSLDGSTVAAVASISFSEPNDPKLNAAVWWSPESPQSPRVLAFQFRVAPDSNESVFKAVTSIAVPGGTCGPIFTATLLHRRVRPQGPPVATNAANDVGLWAVDSTGGTRLLLREGDPLGERTVKSFQVLKAAGCAPGVTRNFNANAEIAVLVTATDNTTHILKVLVP